MVWLVILALLLELGWLSVWPLTASLTHSAVFTAAFLDSHAAARAVLTLLLAITRAVLPDFPDGPLTQPLGSSAYIAPAAALAALLVWLGAWYLAALTLLDRGLGAARSAVWVVLGAAMAFQTTLLSLPGLFSQDVFSYIAYGHLAALHDLNPYIWPPSAIDKDAVVTWVADVWRTYANPYGPLWTDVQWGIARVSGRQPVDAEAMVYRVLANGLLLTNLGLVWVILGRCVRFDRTRKTTALAALAWNPLMLFEVAGNAHNDVLMLSFSLLALLVLSRSGVRSRTARLTLAGVGFTLGALVKYLSGFGLVWVALAAASDPSEPWSRRVVRPVVVALVSGAIILAVLAPWLELPDSLDPLAAETTGVGYVNALPDSFALAFADDVLAPAGITPADARDVSRSLERVVVVFGFGAYLIWESRRVLTSSEPMPATLTRATARACLIYVLVVSTSVQSWYLCVPVGLAVVLGWRSTLARVTIGYSLVALPALYLRYYLRESTPLWVDIVYALGPLGLLAPRGLKLLLAPPKAPGSVQNPAPAGYRDG